MEMYLGKSKSYSTNNCTSQPKFNQFPPMSPIDSFLSNEKKMISPQCVNRILLPAMPISKINITIRVLKIKKKH